MNKIIAVIGLQLLSAATSFAQTSFPLSSPYIYIGRAGTNNSTNPTKIYTASTAVATGFANPVTVTGTTTAVNAVGINNIDGMLYGLGFPNAAATATAGLFRVGADGTSTQLGIVPGPTGGLAGIVNTTAGTVDAAGNYWFTAYRLNGFPPTLSNLAVYIGRVKNTTDLTPGTTNLAVDYFQMNISDPGVQAGFQAFINAFNFSNPGASNGGMEDIALNPQDGKFYSYLTYPNPSNTSELIGRPVVIDMAAKTIAVAGTTLNSASANGAPNCEMAGNYFDNAGNLCVLFTNGLYGQVNLATGALMNVVQSNLPLDNGNLRGDLAANNAGVPLPVKLVSFRGAAINDGVLLQWSLANWNTVSDIRIERSTDGRTFAAIGNVKPDTDYGGFTDPSPVNTAYYRLCMREVSGSMSYSNIIRVAAAGQDAIADIYPNPAQHQLTIRTTSPYVDILMTDMNGRMVRALTVAGNTALSLDGMAKGTYAIQVKDAATGEHLLAQLFERI